MIKSFKNYPVGKVDLRQKVVFLLLFLVSYLAVAQESNPSFTQSKYRVKSITVEGNRRTKAALIIRELGIIENDSLEIANLEKILIARKNNIINTNLFNKVEITKEINGEDLDLRITVEERWYFVAIPEILLADRSFNEWFYDRGRDFSRISYGINAKHFNLTGNNDQLKFKALGGFIPYYEIGYLKPYIDKRKRIGIRLAMYYSTQRTMPFRTWNDKLDFVKSDQINRRRLGGFFELRLKNALYHFHTLSLGFMQTKIADTISVLNPNYFGAGILRQNLFTFSYDYKYDKRDNRQYPLNGQILNLTLSSLMAGKNANTLSLAAKYGKYIPISDKLFYGIVLSGKLSIPNDQLYSLMTGLGYGSVIRGYELFVIDGQHFVLQKSSLKYKLIDRQINVGKITRLRQFKTLPIAVYPNIFYDAGAVKNYFPERSKTKLGNRFLQGGGFGLDFVTWYSTNIKTYYTLNNLKQTGFFFGMSRDF